MHHFGKEHLRNKILLLGLTTCCMPTSMRSSEPWYEIVCFLTLKQVFFPSFALMLCIEKKKPIKTNLYNLQ